MKNHQTVVLIILIVAFGATSLVLSASYGETNSQLNIIQNREIVDNSMRPRFALPKLMKFEQYQKFFDKHYKSIREKVLRAKLYLSRAFRVFISVVSYKHGKSSMYFSVNQMSDRTPAEIRQMFLNDRVILDQANSEARVISPDTQKSSQSDQADLAEVQNTLDEVVERKEKHLIFEELAEELDVESKPVLKEKSIKEPKILSDGPLNDDPIETKAGSQDNNSIVVFKATSILDTLVSSFNQSPINEPYNLPDVTYIDHRHCLGPAQYQGDCGSCYAFSTLALYEWAYCKAKSKLVYFSKQYVVDCGDSKYYLNGCNGGSPTYLGMYLKLIGFLFENDYPYKDKKLLCPYSSQLDITSWGSVRIEVESIAVMSLATVEEKLKVAPLVMIIRTDPACNHMVEYGGGVDNEINCTGLKDSTHAMLLVGSGREDGHEYFLFRNSYGPSYGENGHYKMNKKHTCIYDNEGLVVKFADTPVINEVQKNNQMF